MKKLTMLLISAAIIYIPCHGLSQWQSPDPHRHYHEVCFLTAHNAYASQAHGYRYAQQRLSIRQQLDAGVRALMLDTHKNSLTGEVILCHRSEWVNKMICGGKQAMNIQATITTIKEFLIAHPTEIITIFLENYVREKSLIDGAFRDLEPFILTPADWNPLRKHGWPTIGWMQKHNKRLVIFNSIEKTDLTYYQWQHVVENQWGALYPSQAARERPESAAFRTHPRYLYVINYFPRLKINFGAGYAIINTTGLDAILHRLQEGLGKGYAKKRFPNFVGLDFVDEGDGMQRVLSFNKKPEYETFFYCLKA